MRHLKTFESFSINELQDWTMLPVDVHAGMADLYGQVGREIKSALGSAYQKFITNLESLDLSKISKNDAQKMLDAAGDFFGRDPLALTADDVKKALEKKLPTKLITLKESFVDKYDETDPYQTKSGEPEGAGSFNDVKGGIVQKIGHILQLIFATNIMSLGFLGSWVTSLFGLGVTTNGFFSPYNPFFTMFVSMAAFTIVHIIRKLHKMVAGYE